MMLLYIKGRLNGSDKSRALINK